MKRAVLWAFAALVVLVPLGAGVAVWLCVEDQPLVRRATALTPVQVERATRLIAQHDPRRAPAGKLRTLAIGGEDLDLAASYLAARYGQGAARVVLEPGLVTLRASVELPRSPFGRFLNLHATLRETAALPRFVELRVGRLPVPGWLADLALARALDRLQASERYPGAADTIRRVSIADGQLRVEYEWRQDLPDRLRAALVPAGEEERLRAYQASLARLAGAPALPRRVALPALVGPLLELAGTRAASADPVAENRAALVALAFYVNGKGLAAILPAARHWPRPSPRRVLLGGREDLAQHFAVSAALAATAGGPLSDAVGLYKEVEDARGGSGFSFQDLAADYAGTRLGELATRSAESARRLQATAAAGLKETDIMPAVSDLPEFMTEAELQRRFGGIGAPAYARMLQEIDGRIAALRLHR